MTATHPLAALWSKESRTVAGLMSGTSLDGIDAVIARIAGSGRGVQIETLAFVSVPYSDDLRENLLRNSAGETSSVFDLSQLNVRLAYAYAEAVRHAADAAGLPLPALDLVGSHGQTVHHIPEPTPCAGLALTSTLQIGDPSVLANLLGVPVVGDFRLADMSLGGQGAPLVPYFDDAYFADPGETRGLLNLGGIANLTILPAGGAPTDTYAFDTGPANMVVDALAVSLLGKPFDADGAIAAQGRIANTLVAEMLLDPYFEQPPPKSTGRERFGAVYVRRLLDEGERFGVTETQDLLATATALTAASIYQSYARFVRERHPLDVLIASGGGARNTFLMQKLADSFAPIPVRTTEDYGLDGDAKEALCFALLAHETINGVPSNVPSATGARHATLLGKLCLPPR